MKFIVEDDRIKELVLDNGSLLRLRVPAPYDEREQVKALAMKFLDRFTLESAALSEGPEIIRAGAAGGKWSDEQAVRFLDTIVSGNMEMTAFYQSISEGEIKRAELLKTLRSTLGPTFDSNALRGLLRSIRERYKENGYSRGLHERRKEHDHGKVIHYYRLRSEYSRVVQAWLARDKV